jgi:hypothetical protein
MLPSPLPPPVPAQPRRAGPSSSPAEGPAAPGPQAAACTLRRGLLVAPLLAAAGPALAQMPGGPRGGRMAEGGPAGARPQPGAPAESVPPPDLVAAFERRVLPLRMALDLLPEALAAFDRFAVALHEVAQHNERRLLRIFGVQMRSVSAAAPVQALISGELRDADDRLQALRDLEQSWQALEADLAPAQRDRIHAALNAAGLDTRSRASL